MKTRLLILAVLSLSFTLAATWIVSAREANSPQAQDTWATRASMPTARFGLGAATANNGKLYAIGGYNGGWLTTNEEYDPATDTWATRASMPTPRESLGVAAASNGKLYAIGGHNGSYLTTNEEYDPSTNTWATRASMPTARYQAGVVAASNGKIYVIGGGNGVSWLTTVEEYDPATNTWATRASMPTARGDMGVAAASNGKIYVIGGFYGPTYVPGTYLATVEEYDPATNTWATRASMPTARDGLGVVVASNGKIYAIGGQNVTDGYLAIVEEYDPATDTWATRASMPTARVGLGVAAASNGKLYAMGGWSGSTAATVEEYDPGTDTWATRASMLTARFGLGAAKASNGELYAIGGYNGGWLTAVEEYSPPEYASTVSLIVANGAVYVPSTTVNMHWNISNTSSISGMQFSNDGITYSGWLSFTTDYTWTLSDGDGTKIVNGQYRDISNTVSAVMSDSVILDTQPPIGSVMINGDAAYASVLSVTLNLTATDLSGVNSFQSSNDGSTFSSWITYTTSYSWTLTPGDGLKTVYVRYRDLVGHESDPVTDTITLNASAPLTQVVWATRADRTFGVSNCQQR